MMIEAEIPLTVRIRDQNADVNLEPGRPVEFSEDQAKRLLAKADGRVKVVTQQTDEQEPTLEDWVTWREAEGRVGMGVVTIPRPAGWVDPHDSRFRDGFRAFQKWLDALQPSLRWRETRVREAMQQEFDRMDSCWINGDLLGFRAAIMANLSGP